MDLDMNNDLLTLVNMLLHSSYQFVFLTSISRKLKMHGFAWATMLKEKKCKDSVLIILDFINENGTLELVEIAEPRFISSELTAEFVVTRWEEVENWLKTKIDNVCKKLANSNMKNKLQTIQMLDLILNNILSYS